jgi:hypothetical protein
MSVNVMEECLNEHESTCDLQSLSFTILFGAPLRYFPTTLVTDIATGTDQSRIATPVKVVSHNNIKVN